MGFSGGSAVKNPAANAGDAGSMPGSGRFPWKRKWQPTPVFLPGKSHEQRSLAGYETMGSARVGHVLATDQTRTTKCFFTFSLKRETQGFSLNNWSIDPLKSNPWPLVKSRMHWHPLPPCCILLSTHSTSVHKARAHTQAKAMFGFRLDIKPQTVIKLLELCGFSPGWKAGQASKAEDRVCNLLFSAGFEDCFRVNVWLWVLTILCLGFLTYKSNTHIAMKEGHTSQWCEWLKTHSFGG